MAKTINKFLCYSALGLLFAVDAVAAEISTNTAQMQAMDKITGKVSVIEVPVNGNVKFGSFSILVRDCKTRSPEETPENFAFVDVVDDYESNKPVNIFRGWMVSSSPALNAVEHPIYDVWLLKCIDKPVDKSKLLTEEQLAQRDALETVSASERVVDVKANVVETEQSQEPVAEKTDVTEDAFVAGDAPSPTALVEENLPDVQPEEDGAPKSLLDFGNEQIQKQNDEGAPAMNASDNESETIVEKVVLVESSDTVQTEGSVDPEQEGPTEVLLKETGNALAEQVVEPRPKTKQLIEFEEVIEEPLNFEAEALKKD